MKILGGALVVDDLLDCGQGLGLVALRQKLIEGVPHQDWGAPVETGEELPLNEEREVFGRWRLGLGGSSMPIRGERIGDTPIGCEGIDIGSFRVWRKREGHGFEGTMTIDDVAGQSW